MIIFLEYSLIQTELMSIRKRARIAATSSAIHILFEVSAVAIQPYNMIEIISSFCSFKILTCRELTTVHR